MRSFTIMLLAAAMVATAPSVAHAAEPADFSELPEAWHLQWLALWESDGAMSPDLAELRGLLHGTDPSWDLLSVSDDPVLRWRPLVARWFSPRDVDWALAIISCESNGDPDARSRRSSARGLFQHLETYWAERSASAGIAGASIFDPEANVRVAAWLFYEGGGARHWTCRA